MQDVVITPTGKRAVEVRGFPFAPSRTVSYDVPYRGSLSLTGGLSYSYARIYREQLWVHVAVRKLMKSGANLPLKTYSISPDGNREIVRPSTVSATGKLPTLLRRPAPGLTASRYKRYVIASRAVYGNFLAVKMHPRTPVEGRSVELPNELWPVPWWRVTVQEGKSRPIDWFVVTMDDGARFPFAPEEVVYSSTWSPDSVVGVSPLEPLRQTLAIEDASMRQSRSVFENQARPAGIFTTEQQLSEEQALEIRDRLDELYGGPENAYRTAVLSKGLDWKPLSFSNKQADLVQVRQMSREEIVAVYDIPPPMVGILQHATYSNIETQHRMLYQDTLGPELVEIEEDHEEQLLRPEPQWAKLDLEFDLNEVLKAVIAERAEAYTKLQRLGFPPNYFLHLENQPEIDSPWYRTGYIPRELMPLDPELQAITEAPPEVVDDEEEDEDDDAPLAAVASALGAIAQRPPDEVHVHNTVEPAQPADVQVDARTTVNVPEQKAPEVRVAAPKVNVNMPESKRRKVRKDVIRKDGEVVGLTEEEVD